MFTEGLMREMCGFSSVIRVRLERTTNGLKDHCYDVLNPDIIELTGIVLVLCTLNLCTFS